MGPNRKSRLMRALGIGLVLSALFLVFGGNGQAADDFYALMDGVIARMHAAMHVAPSGDPDRDFARMMIPHHQGPSTWHSCSYASARMNA
jgi:hypothetical protein